jgi:hypothetical protein
MKTLRTFSLLIALASFSLFGCEKQEYFKTKGHIENQLGQHDWKLVQISQGESPNEVWSFSDSKIKITGMSGGASMSGDFSVKTTLNKVFMTTTAFDVATYKDYAFLNGAKWTVIKLNKKVLVIAADDPRGGGLVEREFTAK